MFPIHFMRWNSCKHTYHNFSSARPTDNNLDISFVILLRSVLEYNYHLSLCIWGIVSEAVGSAIYKTNICMGTWYTMSIICFFQCSVCLLLFVNMWMMYSHNVGSRVDYSQRASRIFNRKHIWLEQRILYLGDKHRSISC